VHRRPLREIGVQFHQSLVQKSTETLLSRLAPAIDLRAHAYIAAKRVNESGGWAVTEIECCLRDTASATRGTGFFAASRPRFGASRGKWFISRPRRCRMELRDGLCDGRCVGGYRICCGVVDAERTVA
jgi:hypothetical protein